MPDRSIDRRSFLQMVGLGGTALGVGLTAPHVIAETARGVIVESESEYGPLPVEKLTDGTFPYECDPEVLRAMKESANVFSRNVYDPVRRASLETQEDMSHVHLVENKGKTPNQTRLDWAFMSAAWKWAGSREAYLWEGGGGMMGGGSSALMNMGHWDPADIDMTWEEASLAVRHASLFYGASLVGVAELNRLWLYADHHSPSADDRARAIPVLDEGDRFEKTDDAWYIPSSMNRVIALAFEEDYYGIANSPGRLASAATGDGYSRMALTASTIAAFLRALGYRALPAGNGVGLSIPMAVDAGLGQVGRMGLLMTPKYGPRVRIAKVITDMPLVPTAPIDFGVTEFCEVCMLCADDCPSGTVTKGPRTWEGPSRSNNPGTLKWFAEPEKCYDFNGFSCSNCKRVCPFNKPNNSWLHRMIRQGIEGRIKTADRAMVGLDQASGYGQQLEAREFWSMDGEKSITAREKM
jgi:reductive dehalogenase